MAVIKSGDLVVLKSGGPTMTVDTVNTDIFDDNKITGVLCVWFVGEKLERVRFDHGAIEPVQLELAQPQKALAKDAPSQEASGDYKAVLDEMVDALTSRRRRRSQSIVLSPENRNARELPGKTMLSVRRVSDLTDDIHSPDKSRRPAALSAVTQSPHPDRIALVRPGLTLSSHGSAPIGFGR